MSLLLDALKRAAEQKAAKTKDKKSGSGTAASDETLLDTSAGEASDEADDHSVPRHRLEDETELDHSQLDTLLDRTSTGYRDQTETGLTATDDTEMRAPSSPEQISSGDDETLVFADDDTTGLSGTPAEEHTELSQRAELEDQTEFIQRVEDDDETDITQGTSVDPAHLADQAESEDQTEFIQRVEDADETDITQGASLDPSDLTEQVESEDQTEFIQRVEDADRTDITQGTSVDPSDLTEQVESEDQTEFVQRVEDAEATDIPEGASGDLAGLTQRGTPEDETEFLQQAQAAEVTGFTEDSSAEKSDLTQGVSPADVTESGRAEPDDEDTTDPDEDLSLLLVDREPTQFTSSTSITDPQQLQDKMRVLRSESPVDEEGTQADATRGVSGEDQTSSTDTAQMGTRSSDTSTTSPAAATRSARAAMARNDATSTHTYAPDNYDRTLMRLPNDDASKLFAGMKSESDVVMTPDYAKQVFRSKSSAQRLQNYKFYAAIAIVILLSIGIYGVFEFQSESEIIDTSLRPLKNDPMPGIIRPATSEQEAEPLFVEAEVNERALEVIQSIEESGSADETQPVADEAAVEQASPPESAPVATADTAPAAESPPAPRQAAEESRDSAATTQSMASSEGEKAGQADDTTISGTISFEPTADPGSSSSRLRIETSERIEEKQTLLREAYAAYQSGDDERALQAYNKVLDIDPGNRNALLARAAINVQNGNSAAAIEDYQRLLLDNPKDSLAMASLLSVASYSPRETETQLKLMIREEPESPYLNFALANAYSAQNRWQEAQGHYYRALQNNPDDPNYAYNLAVSLEHISQPGAAVSYYRRALENYNKGLATFSRDAVDRRLEKLTKP